MHAVEPSQLLLYARDLIISPIVSIPNRASRSFHFSPTPAAAPTGDLSKCLERSSPLTQTGSSGLSLSEALLAHALLGAMPIDHWARSHHHKSSELNQKPKPSLGTRSAAPAATV